MKTIFLNPHVADFCYRPVSFALARRRALRKYSYLDALFGGELYSSPGETSLPRRWSNRLPSFAKRVLSFFEAKAWSQINERELVPVDDTILANSNVFLFGYKTGRDTLNFLKRKGFKNRIFLHLSHYHTFEISLGDFEELDITLLFDTDVSHHSYFRKKFPTYKGHLRVLPFQIDDRFFAEEHQKKQPRIAATGTYHSLPDGTLDITYNGTSTLHPVRLAFAQSNVEADHLENHLSLFESQSIWSVLVGQRKYMSLNIADLYKTSSHAFVGAEGTGAIAIGTLEAMAAGCIPFVTEDELRGCIFDSADASFEFYDGIDDLIEKTLAFDAHKSTAAVMANVNCARAYQANNLEKLAANIFDADEVGRDAPHR
jgi:hypothetical protein